MIVDVAGSYALKFEAGHYCGKNYGFGVYIAKHLGTPITTEFNAGGVMDFRDIERLYKWAKRYQKKYPRKSLSEIYK